MTGVVHCTAMSLRTQLEQALESTRLGSWKRDDILECLWPLLTAALDQARAETDQRTHVAMILLDEARDAIQALTTTQVRMHGVSPSLANRIDALVDSENERRRVLAETQEAP